MTPNVVCWGSQIGRDNNPMPRYDIKCPSHGVVEIVRAMSDNSPYRCECGAEARVVITSVMPARIDDQVNVGTERREQHGMNLGLPGVTDSNGRYRAISSNEVGSNRNAKELAKRANLSPIEGGRYRSTP